jgi:hypothetical protein
LLSNFGYAFAEMLGRKQIELGRGEFRTFVGIRLCGGSQPEAQSV